MGSFFKKLINQSERHWVCLKKFNDFFVLLDSLKQEPEYLSIEKTLKYLDEQKKLGSTLLAV